jgi:hypothetical protein
MEKRYQLSYLNGKPYTALLITVLTLGLSALLLYPASRWQLPLSLYAAICVFSWLIFPVGLAYWLCRRLPQMVIADYGDRFTLIRPGQPDRTIQKDKILKLSYGIPHWKMSMLERERLQIVLEEETVSIHHCVFDDAGRKMLRAFYGGLQEKKEDQTLYWG